jgi:hypothetical protein
MALEKNGLAFRHMVAPQTDAAFPFLDVANGVVTKLFRFWNALEKGSYNASGPDPMDDGAAQCRGCSRH